MTDSGTSRPFTAALTELRAGDLRLVLRADQGGSIAGLWLGDLPVMRSREAADMQGPRSGASFPMLPYSNRLGYCRFRWAGLDYTTRPNFEGSPHSLHGVAWQSPWNVDSASASEAVLSCAHLPDAHWPFAYSARQTIALTPGALELRLAVTNLAPQAVPMGLGWHPYFPKRSRSRLHIEVTHRWENDATKLPTRRVPQPGIDADVAHLDFDHCFDGFGGAARIRDEKLSLRLTSSVSRLVVFTPPERDYFAVEPVSHVSNAIHMADPMAHGLVSLPPGATESAWMRLEVSRA
jgi:aldose 1-epimerase